MCASCPRHRCWSNARARVDFTERGASVAAGNGTARVFGGDVTFDGGTQPDGTLRFNALGNLGADGLRRVADEPTLARLVQRVSGQTTYRLSVGILKGQTELAFTSSLAGVGLALPPPLNKPPDAAWPLRVAAVIAYDAQGHARDTLRVDLGHPQAPLLQAEVQRDLSGRCPGRCVPPTRSARRCPRRSRGASRRCAARPSTAMRGGRSGAG